MTAWTRIDPHLHKVSNIDARVTRTRHCAVYRRGKYALVSAETETPAAVFHPVPSWICHSVASTGVSSPEDALLTQPQSLAKSARRSVAPQRLLESRYRNRVPQTRIHTGTPLWDSPSGARTYRPLMDSCSAFHQPMPTMPRTTNPLRSAAWRTED